MNQTEKFILPMISTTDMKNKFFINKYFIGCYIGDTNNNRFQDKIMIAYKFEPSIPFIEFEKELSKNPYIRYGEEYDYDEKNVVMYVFNVPKEHMEDYYLILDGKYSEISNILKLKILKFWGENEISLLYSILFKTEKIKEFWEKTDKNYKIFCADEEYWYLPKLDSEIFNIKDI
jgi:hypothetical protein